MKWIISGQIPDSPPPQQSASEPISGLTGLYVYLFFPNLFASQINIIFPSKKQKKNKMLALKTSCKIHDKELTKVKALGLEPR